jgi:hypothetical protein
METLLIELARWIEEETPPIFVGDIKPGVTIGQCIPPIFDAYCKVFHPFEVNPDEPEILEQNLEPRFPLTFNGTRDELFEIYKKEREEHDSKRWNFVRWESVAEKYGLVFYNQISPESFVKKFRKTGWQKNLNFPMEGHLPRSLLINILDILILHSPKDEVHIYQMPPNTIWKNKFGTDLVKCNFGEVLIYFVKDFIGYLYPADKSWILYTNTDLTFTIVGGPNKLIERFMNNDIEALECNSYTRVDDGSDQINL